MDEVRPVQPVVSLELSRRSALGLLLASAAMPLVGCRKSKVTGDLRTESVGPEVLRYRGRFTSSLYNVQDEYVLMVLSEIPLEQFGSNQTLEGQFVTVNLLWRPIAGRTPLDDQATNASIRQVIFSGGKVGVYAGAGMAYPGKIGRKSLKVSLDNASMTLIESTPGFNDLLSPAAMNGNFRCRLDPQSTERMRFAASQAVTDALGRTYRV